MPLRNRCVGNAGFVGSYARQSVEASHRRAHILANVATEIRVPLLGVERGLHMYSTAKTPSSAPGRVGPQHCLRLWTRQLVWSIVYNRKQWHPFAITSTTKVALSN